MWTSDTEEEPFSDETPAVFEAVVPNWWNHTVHLPPISQSHNIEMYFFYSILPYGRWLFTPTFKRVSDFPGRSPPKLLLKCCSGCSALLDGRGPSLCRELRCAECSRAVMEAACQRPDWLRVWPWRWQGVTGARSDKDNEKRESRAEAEARGGARTRSPPPGDMPDCCQVWGGVTMSRDRQRGVTGLLSSLKVQDVKFKIILKILFCKVAKHI